MWVQPGIVLRIGRYEWPFWRAKTPLLLAFWGWLRLKLPPEKKRCGPNEGRIRLQMLGSSALFYSFFSYSVCMYQMTVTMWHVFQKSAHCFCPVLPVTLGHWPRPRVMSSLSNGLWSSMQKTPFKFWHMDFCELLSRPFDKIKMTWGRGRWPRDLRKLGWFLYARYSEKSTHISFQVAH